MNIQGTVISFTANKKVKKQGGGQYDAWELIYNSPEGEVKVLAKPTGGLRFNPSLASGLNSLKPGDEFTGELEKNENGFWDVKSVMKGFVDGAGSVGSNSAVGAGRGSVPARSGVTPKSTYETPEERAKRQVIISRLACVNTAIEMMKAAGKPAETADEAIDVAKRFEGFVYKNLGRKATEYLQVELLDKEAMQPDNGAKDE